MNEAITKWLNSNYKNYQKKNPPLEQSVLDHVIDWMQSDDAKGYLDRLDRVAVPAAIGLSNKWTEKINKANEKKIKQQQDPDHKGIISVFKFDDGYSVVKVVSDYSLQREGYLMGHCVGSYTEESNIQEGLEIYSLRDSKNQPHCTIEFELKAKHISQIKGKANQLVIPKYHKYVVDFLNQFNFDSAYSHDLKNISAIYYGNYIFQNESIPANVEINKNLKVDLVNYIHTFDKLVVNGDCFLSKNKRCKKIANTLIVKGDLVIEDFYGLLKIADNLIVEGSIELVDCDNIKHLANSVSAQGLYVSNCPHFTKKNYGFELEVA